MSNIGVMTERMEKEVKASAEILECVKALLTRRVRDGKYEEDCLEWRSVRGRMGGSVDLSKCWGGFLLWLERREASELEEEKRLEEEEKNSLANFVKQIQKTIKSRWEEAVEEWKVIGGVPDKAILKEIVEDVTKDIDCGEFDFSIDVEKMD